MVQGKLNSAYDRLSNLLASHPDDGDLQFMRYAIEMWSQGVGFIGTVHSPKESPLQFPHRSSPSLIVDDKYKTAGEWLHGSLLAGKSGNFQQQYDSAMQAHALVRGDTDLIEMSLLSTLGKACNSLGKHDEAMQYFAAAESIAKELNNSFGEADAIQGIALGHYYRGNTSECIRLLDRVVSLYDELIMFRGAVMLLSSELGGGLDTFAPAKVFAELSEFRARLAQDAGDRKNARVFALRAAELWNLARNGINESNCYVLASDQAVNLGDLAASNEYLERAISADAAIGFTDRHYIAMFAIARNHAILGNQQLALAAWERAEQNWELASSRKDDPARAEEVLASIRSLGGQKQEAYQLMGRVVEIQRRGSDKARLAMVLNNYAHTANEAGKPRHAEALARESLSIAHAAGETRVGGYARATLSEALAAQGNLTGAYTLATESLAILRDYNDLNGQAEALFTLGRVRATQGEVSEAATLLVFSIEKFREAGNLSRVAVVESFIAATLAPTPISGAG